MKEPKPYIEAFRKQVLEKVYYQGDQTAQMFMFTNQLNLNDYTLIKLDTHPEPNHKSKPAVVKMPTVLDVSTTFGNSSEKSWIG